MMLTGTVKSESEQTVQPDHYDGSQGGHGGYNGGGIRGIQRRPWRKRWLLPSRLLLQKLPWRRKGFSASRIIPLGPVRQRSTSPGRTLPGLDQTPYRFGVQKRQGSFRMERESNPDGGCHHRPHRPVLPLGLPRPD
uniref:Uncharacterized protein n=1 Tax=Brassica oleracea var. oleracea TaxID=109376 RepID=A0A0D3B4A8_BRAOL